MTICPDCLVSPGQPHEPGCDVARCLVTGHQALSCPYTHDHGADTWTGVWPGVRECWEFGWFAKFSPEYGWRTCRPDDPERKPDLNRLSGPEAEWDRESGRWVLSEWSRMTGYAATSASDNAYSVKLDRDSE